MLKTEIFDHIEIQLEMKNRRMQTLKYVEIKHHIFK
jgi:hypothetical protein